MLDIVATLWPFLPFAADSDGTFVRRVDYERPVDGIVEEPVDRNRDSTPGRVNLYTENHIEVLVRRYWATEDDIGLVQKWHPCDDPLRPEWFRIRGQLTAARGDVSGLTILDFLAILAAAPLTVRNAEADALFRLATLFEKLRVALVRSDFVDEGFNDEPDDDEGVLIDQTEDPARWAKWEKSPQHAVDRADWLWQSVEKTILGESEVIGDEELRSAVAEFSHRAEHDFGAPALSLFVLDESMRAPWDEKAVAVIKEEFQKLQKKYVEELKLLERRCRVEEQRVRRAAIVALATPAPLTAAAFPAARSKTPAKRGQAKEANTVAAIKWLRDYTKGAADTAEEWLRKIKAASNDRDARKAAIEGYEAVLGEKALIDAARRDGLELRENDLKLRNAPKILQGFRNAKRCAINGVRYDGALAAGKAAT